MSESINPSQATVADDEIDLRELFAAIWQGKWIIVATTFIFTVAAVSFALNLPNIYKSEALLAPAAQQKNSGLSSQLGGLAALAGVNLNSGSSIDKTALAIEIIKSREFIGKFVEHNDLLLPLLAAKGWNRNSNKIIIDEEYYDEKTLSWVREVEPPKLPEPSPLEAHAAFVKILSVKQDETSGMVKLSIEHVSPYLAKEWVDKIVISINAEMKQRDIEEAEASILYLKNQIRETNISEIRSSLFTLIEEQTKTLMLANVRDEYAFKVVDKAVVPEEKFKPKRAMIVIIACLLGFMSSAIFTIIRSQIKK